MLKTPLCDVLGIEKPVFQGGMAWIADASLAAAVSEAGGLGIIAAMNADAEWLREQIHELRRLTDKPFGVNVMLMSPFADEVAQVVIDEKVPVAVTGAGDPRRFMKGWPAAGIKVIPVVASVALAKLVVRAGATAAVAEGTESGGHIGELTTMVLVPQVVDAVPRMPRPCTCVSPMGPTASVSCGELPQRGRGPDHGREVWRQGNPPRLRALLGERGLRARVREVRPCVRRPFRRGHRPHGRQGRRPPHREGCGRARDSRLRLAEVSRGGGARGAPHRVPVLIKARSGGGGRGIRKVERAGDAGRAFSEARAEAEAAFGDGSFYFMEMNTRLQVEHPVTEFVTDVDLVKWQLRVAAGQALPFECEDLPVAGHAMECRINAETPDYLPSCGTVTMLHVPGGPKVRFDSALFSGAVVPPYYDSMLAKVIVCASTRDGTIRKMRSALGELVIEGVDENSELQLRILANEEFLSGNYHTNLMEGINAAQ